MRNPFGTLVFFALAALAPVACSSSDDGPTVTDSGAIDSGAADAATDSKPTDAAGDAPPADASADTCTPAGGTCVAVTPSASCPTGTAISGDPAFHCAGVGANCCLPTPTKDSGIDAANVCEAKGGTCIAVTPSASCPTGTTPSSDPCGGVGATCCAKVADAGADAAK